LVMAAFYVFVMGSWFYGQRVVSQFQTEKNSRLTLSNLCKRTKRADVVSVSDAWVLDEYKIVSFSTTTTKARKQKLRTLPRLGIFINEVPLNDTAGQIKSQEKNETNIVLFEEKQLPTSLSTLIDSLYVIPETLLFLEVQTSFKSHIS
jgi:hypothetical protein